MVLIVELLYHGLNKNISSLKAKELIRHAKLFLPYYKVEEMNLLLKTKSLVKYVKLFQFLPYYKVEQSKSEDFELDDVYVVLVDDPISNGVESKTSFMSDHVDQ